MGALALACSDDTESPSTSSIRVVIGTGLSEYEPLDGEPTVPLISGIQGGFHVWTSFITYGFDTDVVYMELSTSTDGVPDSVLPQNGTVALRPAFDDAGEPVLTSVGWPAIVYDPKCAHGRRLRLSLTVTDRESGLRARDSRHCIVDVPPEYRESNCGAE